MAMKFGSVAPKCKQCTKSVYENEKIEYDGNYVRPSLPLMIVLTNFMLLVLRLSVCVCVYRHDLVTT